MIPGNTAQVLLHLPHHLSDHVGPPPHAGVAVVVPEEGEGDSQPPQDRNTGASVTMGDHFVVWKIFLVV